MRREAPLEILHLAAHCHNVPVTSTLDLMFGVESIFQGRNPRNRHSWLTCITSSMERARECFADTSDRAAEQRLFEFPASEFPVYFVGGSLNYTFMSAPEVISALQAAPNGDPERAQFNVYRFSREYVWGKQEYCSHYHVFSETLVEFRAGRGELYAVLRGDEV